MSENNNDNGVTKVKDCDVCDMPGDKIEIKEAIFDFGKPYYCKCPRCGNMGGKAPTEYGAVSKWNKGYRTYSLRL